MPSPGLLGLAIVRDLVTEIGGTVRVVGATGGRGAVFVVCIPAVIADDFGNV